MTPRIRFFSPDNENETGEHLRLIQQIDDFWKAFWRVSEERQVAWIPELRQQLKQVHPGLGLEVRPEPDGTRMLSILPLAGARLRPLAALVASRAESRVPWLVETARQPRPLGEALRLVQQDTKLELSAARCRVGLGRGHLVSVVIASHLFSSDGDELAQRAAEQLVELLLGDEAFEDWVGDVSVVPAPRPNSLRVIGAEESSLPLRISELTEAFGAARASVIGALPEDAYHRFCERAPWVMFELEEQQALAEHVQPNLLMAGTSCPEMLKCFLLGAPFSSLRFSRNQERFCTLKLALGGSQEEQVLARQQLEDILNFGLVPGRLGCVVGSGTGSEFMYIYLALQQVDAAITWILKKLRAQARVPRGWLLFCDAEWQDEWLSLSPDASQAPHLP